MRKDLTDITVVMDRSGSMAATRKDAEGGLNAFIDDQARRPGFATFTLVQFDTKYEFVHRAVPIQMVGHCRLEPRGCTALLDAVGRAVSETGERLRMMLESDRPGLVVFVIVTDGEENSSREYTKDQVKNLIDRQHSEWKWEFIFLGANVDAFAEARSIGIPYLGTVAYDEKNPVAVYAAASSNVGRMRVQSFTGQAVSNAFTDEERESTAKKEE